jgi:hypothetical protein
LLRSANRRQRLLQAALQVLKVVHAVAAAVEAAAVAGGLTLC